MTNRRNFLKKAAAVSAITVVSPSIAFGSKANSAIRLGIIGSGARGTWVITSMLQNTNTQLVAMADLLEDRLLDSKKVLDAENVKKGFPKVQKSNTYVGPDAYLRLLDNKDVDAVLISSPAYTHPDFIEAAVAAGKHVYSEKPVAPDVAGCKKVEKIGERLNSKVSLAVGFQVRHATPYVEMIKRIHRGDIGEVISAELNYFSAEVPMNSNDSMSYDERRIRDHFHYRALSGGILLDQGIHILDIANMTLKSRPVSAVGIGGRAGVTFGDAWSNFQILYKYENGVNLSLQSTQIGPRFGDVAARFVGSKGTAEAHYAGGVYIMGDNPWDSGVTRDTDKLFSSLYDADAKKDQHWINSIESGNYLNETDYAVESTLATIMGRDAATSGQRLTWDEMYYSDARLDSKLNLSQFKK